MTAKESIDFTVENGINTCYVDSVLMGLFYTPSNIYYNMLECDPKNDVFLYFQELLKYNFIDNVRKNKSITSDNINNIRNYMFFNINWLNNKYEELLEQQDVSEFYTFLVDNMSNNMHIEIKRKTITEGLDSASDTGIIEKIPFIPLSLTKITDNKEISIKDLLSNWLTNNPVTVTRETIIDGKKVKQDVPAINIYQVTNIPTIVPLHINRFTSFDVKKNNTMIDIKEKIRLFDINDDLGKIKWSIHSAICHTGDSIKNGHYYTLLINANRWLMFDNMSIPCLSEVDMSNSKLIDKIKSEVIFIIYKFD